MRGKVAFTYQLKNYFKQLGWTYLWAFCLIAVLPFALSVLFGQAHVYSFTDYLPSELTSMVLGLFVFVSGAITYDGFKLFIQNGIGRRTYFKTKVTALGVIILAGEAINLIYGAVFQTWLTPNGPYLMGFSKLYGHYFGNSVADNLSVLLITLLFIACVAVTGMVVGGILGQFSRRGQIIMIVAVPILMIILFFVLILLNQQSSLKLTWLGNLLLLMVGAQPNMKLGHMIAYAPMISGSIYTVMMLAITYRLTLRLRIPR